MSVPGAPFDPWAQLRGLTAARIALGSTGGSLPTARLLEFQADHARARDAVHAALDADRLGGELARMELEVIHAHSAAPDRATYLQRPDLGRCLDAASRARLAKVACGSRDAVFVVADGLSALAVQRHAAPLLAGVTARLRADGWRLAPVVIVRQGRVAVGDEVGALLGAGLVAVLIGERPGLSAPDSLGVYLTHDPRPGRVDAERNCISNIRPEGLPAVAAAHKLAWLMTEARRRAVTGIALRDESPVLPPSSGPPQIATG
jgi:ethanolamine ammonia-lyase small subunit